MTLNKNKTILLVEDESIIAMAQKMCLEKYGYNVITAYSGLEAIESVKSNSEIELILMDIDLGHGIGGTETAEIILKEKAIPVVFLSSHTEKEIVEKTERITSYGYVVKDSNITVLDASIKMAFKLFKAKENELAKEIALKRSENLFRTTIESIPFDLFALDCNQYYIIQNTVSRNTWGDIIGKRPEDVAENKASLLLWKENNKRVLNGETIKGEVITRVHGEDKLLYNIISPIWDDGTVTGILGINIDITKQT